MGQLPYFAEFLETPELFERWVQQCPLHYSSGNALAVRDVLGTWMFSILNEHRRYAQIANLRMDAVAPEILGMNRSLETRVCAAHGPYSTSNQREPQRGTTQTTTSPS